MLYVDIYIRIYSLPFEEKHPKSHFQMICLMLIKKTFGLFLCPRLLLVATRWHWRACKWTLCGVKFIMSPGFCGTEEIIIKKKTFAESFFSVTDRCDHRCFCRIDDRERTQKKASKNKNCFKT